LRPFSRRTLMIALARCFAANQGNRFMAS